MAQIFNDDVQIIGDEDIIQLLVKGHASQTASLQAWQDASGNTLAELVEDGRLRIGGDLTTGAPSALLEANQQLSSSEAVKQGWQSRGEISGQVAEALAWIVHELELEGSGGISSLVSVLRSTLTHSNTGNASQADLRAGEFQVVNQTGTAQTPVSQAAALSGVVSNDAAAYLAKAMGLLARILEFGSSKPVVVKRQRLFCE